MTPQQIQHFVAGNADPASFGHRDHLVMAHAMLTRDTFLPVAANYARGIRGMAVRADKPEAYNETVTLAFLSLIAERHAQMPELGSDAFIEANPDLMQRDCLSCFYTDARRTSPLARAMFIMPDRIAR